MQTEPDRNSIAGLLELLRQLEVLRADLHDDVIHRERFMQLGQLLEKLILSAGGCREIRETYVSWFNHGLKSFERAAEAVVSGRTEEVWNLRSASTNPSWLMLGWVELEPYLRHDILGWHCAPMRERALGALEKLRRHPQGGVWAQLALTEFRTRVESGRI